MLTFEEFRASSKIVVTGGFNLISIYLQVADQNWDVININRNHMDFSQCIMHFENTDDSYGHYKDNIEEGYGLIKEISTP